MKITEKKVLKNQNNINFKYKKILILFKDINNQKKINKLLSCVSSFSGKIIFSLTENKYLKKFLQFLKKHNIYPKYIKNILNINQNIDYFYMIDNIQNSFLDKKNNILFICIEDLLPELINHQNDSDIKKNINLSKKGNLSQLIFNHPIIHIEHGIGRYKGLTTIKTASIQSEYLIIAYAEGDKLYVPVSYLHLILPYNETSIEDAPLHKLGSEEWNKEKNKISNIIHDHASHLLKIHANRAIQKGYVFKIDIKLYKQFCNDCLFQITKDQHAVMTSVIEDMSKSIPMDRLICGDVGFGKTEIAMRAAFISVSNNKQVVVLVPTTLLAQQHYENFKKRFCNYSFSINILSRFQTLKEQNIIFQQSENGKINIVIGTHKLLFKKIKWFNLGLLIIDEEHRFGVHHKEIIKKMYSNIDILTLTATPIPRTLNMAMTGIKDLSIISSPPSTRLAIKTFIQEYNPLLIRKIILREITRGGQIYYIYNKVQNIINVAKKLSILIPEANIRIGHGQMNNIDLKKVMHEFYNNQFNVLVCTTIIESGVDIPKANTIIIENADHFGLSQLHQLRGRVGRSNNQAYALLLVNNFKTITSDAKKRLEAISSVDNFGGGFSLSNQDLEIRGVGEILGQEQSGHIKNIGFSLYIELLNNAVNLLKKGKLFSQNKRLEKSLDIKLYVSSLLPDDYILDVNTRLFFYRRLSNAINEKEIEEIQNELIDQFGKLPDFAKNLIIIAKIRLIADQIGIKYIKSNHKTGLIKFYNENFLNIKYLLKIFQKEPHIWKMVDTTKIKFIIHFDNDYLRLKWILDILKNLYNHNV
ncbi:transcription-repair coupling factor [Buchnera aphidicola]|uniref:Transcription-repair-coupling factor n=1 Tax=Buchnera aphidicola str. Ua (Uroleucon ambrosiae) TaxID=1005057 RepID=G2LPF5_BUCUM|nr:transcription-repair coupling factor [Buchnera aphidicola]AEO08092.1 transcription-repair coupling factor [Buchnera aphidicola str. Ua (Uroleucon ambrosiae)]